MINDLEHLVLRPSQPRPGDRANGYQVVMGDAILGIVYENPAKRGFVGEIRGTLIQFKATGRLACAKLMAAYLLDVPSLSKPGRRRNVRASVPFVIEERPNAA